MEMQMLGIEMHFIICPICTRILVQTSAVHFLQACWQVLNVGL